MKFFKKPLLFVALAAVLLPMTGFAQYQYQVDPLFSYFKDPKRYELGFNFLNTMGDFDGAVRVTGPGGSFVGDSNAKRSLTGQNIGGDIGLSLPFKMTGHISCWALSVHLWGNMLTWSDLNQTMATDGTYTTGSKSLDATTIQIGLPIGVEWKAGCDAILTKRLTFGTALGAGFIPQFNMTSINNSEIKDPGYGFGCTPYVKAEGAIFAGLCIKVRVMYTMGDIRMIDVQKSISGLTDGPFRITQNSNLVLSLIIMPFSGGWEETGWWNTHDSYNQHDRLN